ncbi:MAG: serine/threonine-protein kinase [Gemmatimonas sp.]
MFDTVRTALSGQFTLDREIGRGGMGVVYLAREVQLDRVVAIKVLPRHLGADPIMRERFLREARTAAQLSHPHIVPIFRADALDGFAFFTMAFIDGENLADRVRERGPMSVADAVRVLREVAWALAYAHARGLVHRDIKPENIMIERSTNRAFVTDFGIARDALAATLTHEGLVMGSAHYMSPEQATGEAVDGRSDLYSLGVVGFHVLSGLRPFEGPDVKSIMAQQVTKPAPPLASVATRTPAAIAAVIDRCLNKEAADRYATGEELADALQRAFESSPPVRSVAETDVAISTGQARALWARAAQLQAEAGSRLNEKYRREAASEVERSVPASSLRMIDAEQAAAEAGIASEFMAMAVAEKQHAVAETNDELTPREDALLTRAMGTSHRSLSMTRLIHAPPKAVLESMGRVFTNFPFSLKLRDTVGGHPLDGGVMVFDVNIMRMMNMTTYENSQVTPFNYRMTQLAVERINATIRAVGRTGDECEVTVYCDLRQGLRKNWTVDKWLAGLSGAGGAFGGTVFGLAGLSLGGLAALTGAGGAVLLGAGALGAYRLLYRSALKHGRKELDNLLRAIDEEMRVASVFGISGAANRDRRLK